MSEGRFTARQFYPRFVLADKGYSSWPLYSLLKGQYKTQSIIDPNPQQKRYAEMTAAMRATPGWQALYKQRVSVERAYSQLKRMHSLNQIKVRGLKKVTVHCYLSLISLQVSYPNMRPSNAPIAIRAIEPPNVITQ